MEDIVRIGFISSVDPEQGTARVYYQDRDSVTADLHLFAFRSEFSPPAVGDMVVVLHLSNDSSSGVILGKFWGEANRPPQTKEYRKQIGSDTYETLKNGAFIVHSQEIQLESGTGSITLSELMDLRRRIELLERKG